MQDPRGEELKAKLRGRPHLKKGDDRPLPLSRDIKLDKLKALRRKERPLSNPLQGKVEQLEKQLEVKPVVIETELPDFTSATQRLVQRLRKILTLNRQAEEAGEETAKRHATTIYRLAEKSAQLDRSLEEAAGIKDEASDLLAVAARKNASLELEREGLERDKKAWANQLPALKHRVELARKELDATSHQVSSQKFALVMAEKSLASARLGLATIEVDVETARQKRDEVSIYEKQVSELKSALIGLERDKSDKSLEWQGAVALREQTERRVSALATQEVAKRAELSRVVSDISEAQDALKSLQDASGDIVARTRKSIEVALKKRGAIEEQAKTIIPKLNAQLETVKILQSTLQDTIADYQRMTDSAKKAERNYRKAEVEAVKQTEAKKTATSILKITTGKLITLVAQAQDKFNEYTGKILLLEPMFTSIAEAQNKLTDLLAYNKETKLSVARERKVLIGWREELTIKEKQLEDREKTLSKAKKELDGLGTTKN